MQEEEKDERRLWGVGAGTGWKVYGRLTLFFVLLVFLPVSHEQTSDARQPHACLSFTIKRCGREEFHEREVACSGLKFELRSVFFFLNLFLD